MTRNIFKKASYITQAIAAYVIYCIFWILPIDIASWLGGKIGELLGKFLLATNIATRNLEICNLQFNGEEKKIIIKRMWNNLGRIVAELPHWHSVSDGEFQKRVTIDGHLIFDHLVEHAIYKKVILLSGHFGNWELYNRLVQFIGLKACFIYQHLNNPYVDRLINCTRQKTGTKLLKKGFSGTRQIIAELKKPDSSVLGMLIDQRSLEGVRIPFFGIGISTIQTPAVLSERYNIPIIMCKVVRTAGARYRISIMPPFLSKNINQYIEEYKNINSSEGEKLRYITQPNDQKNDNTVYKTTTFLNYVLSEWIVEHPDQWFLVHRRFPKELYRPTFQTKN